MSRLKGADLGIAIPATPTAAAIGAAKNTVGAGLPSFIGRLPGDQHLDSTTGKAYTLTGAAGVTIADTFTRADTASGLGLTETGAKTWLTSNASTAITTQAKISSNTAAILTSGTRAYLDTGSTTVAGKIFAAKADLLALSGVTNFSIENDGTSPGSVGYTLALDTGFNRVALYRTGAQVAGGWVAAASVTAGSNHTVELTHDGSGVVKAYLDGVQVFSYTDGTPLHGRYFALEAYCSGLDNITVLQGGSLTWTPNQATTGTDGSTPLRISLGAARSTVGSGLPSFVGRVAGDTHYDTSTGREYVLTGTPALTVTDDFNRFADNAAISGQATQTGSKTWAVQGTPVINSGKMQAGIGLVNTATTGTAYQDVAFDGSFSSDTGNQFLHAILRADSPSLNSYIDVIWYSGNGVVYRRGNQISLGSFTHSVTASNQTHRFMASIDANGLITVSVDGVQVFTATDNTLTGAYVGASAGGFQAGFTPNTVDNIAITGGAGTLAWTFTTPLYMQTQVITGNAAVASNLVKPGLRVPTATTLRQVVLRCETAPVGGPLTVTVERFNNGVSQGVIATISIPDGLTVGSVTGLTASCAQGDILKFNCTAVGPTTAGADVAASLDFF